MVKKKKKRCNLKLAKRQKLTNSLLSVTRFITTITTNILTDCLKIAA